MERHVPVDHRCKRCDCSESILHLFFQCPYAQRVWQLAPFTTALDVSRIIDLMASWETLCSLNCLPPAGITSGSLFPWVLWSIWKARNKFVFEGHSASPEDTLSAAIALAREWSQDVTKESPNALRSPPQQIPSPPGTVVVRSDAAWSSVSKKAGLGWVILDEAETNSFQSSASPVLSPLAAEGLALREAVKHCRGEGRNRTSFELDSAQLVKALNSGPPSKELYCITADVNYFISAFEFVSFVWIPRERNSTADCLAKDALNVSEQEVGGAFIAPN